MSVGQKEITGRVKSQPTSLALSGTSIIAKPATVSARNNLFIYSEISVFVLPTFFTDA